MFGCALDANNKSTNIFIHNFRDELWLLIRSLSRCVAAFFKENPKSSELLLPTSCHCTKKKFLLNFLLGLLGIFRFVEVSVIRKDIFRPQSHDRDTVHRPIRRILISDFFNWVEADFPPFFRGENFSLFAEKIFTSGGISSRLAIKSNYPHDSPCIVTSPNDGDKRKLKKIPQILALKNSFFFLLSRTILRELPNSSSEKLDMKTEKCFSMN